MLARSTSSASPAPLSATTPNSADDQTQHQALKKFFDDLINKRNRVDDKAATAKSPDGDGGADEEGNTAEPREMMSEFADAELLPVVRLSPLRSPLTSIVFD